jgi:hypothetical protein
MMRGKGITSLVRSAYVHTGVTEVMAGFVPQTQVLLWMSGEQWRAVFETVVLAEYHGRDDWHDGKVKDIRAGVWSPTRFASPQGSLLPLTPQDFVVVYRTKQPRRRTPRLSAAQQLLLFELVPIGYGRLQCAPV